MALLAVVNRWFFLLGLPLLRRIPFVRDLPLVHGWFWVREFDLPEQDRRALASSVNSGTVAFIGPNHPEFGTDWMVDKEISTLVAPRMASWADRGIVAGAPRFWGMNNLVANDGGAAAKDYSVEWALEGEGVLLHPEGSVRWTNDRIHALYPGIAQMAMQAAERTERPVYIVPIVWKYRFVGDVSRRMHREMRILEEGLSLPQGDVTTVAGRFHALQMNVLAQRMRRFGYGDAPGDFFERQVAFQRHLVTALEEHYHTDDVGSVDRRIARIARSIRDERSALGRDAASADRRAVLKEHLAMADEAKRLGEFSREVYGSPMLSQEQLFESLKRLRDRLLREGWKNAVAIMMPKPFGPRVVHVGVPDAIRVSPVAPSHAKDYETSLLEHARARMQEKLDEINARIAPEVARYAHANPFVDALP